jgi:hypothetical protein
VLAVAIVFRENNLPGQGDPPTTNCFNENKLVAAPAGDLAAA